MKIIFNKKDKEAILILNSLGVTPKTIAEIFKTTVTNIIIILKDNELTIKEANHD